MKIRQLGSVPKVMAAMFPQRLGGPRLMRSAPAAERSVDPSTRRRPLGPGSFVPGSLISHPVPKFLTQSSRQKGPREAQQVQERREPRVRGSTVGTNGTTWSSEAGSSARGV